MREKPDCNELRPRVGYLWQRAANPSANPRLPMPPPFDFDAFLSYNWEDKSAARELKRVLEARKLTIWFDEDQLRPGLELAAVA
jgi:hypothetical protein